MYYACSAKSMYKDYYDEICMDPKKRCKIQLLLLCYIYSYLLQVTCNWLILLKISIYAYIFIGYIMDYNDSQGVWVVAVGILVAVLVISWILLMAVCLKELSAKYKHSQAKQG